MRHKVSGSTAVCASDVRKIPFLNCNNARSAIFIRATCPRWGAVLRALDTCRNSSLFRKKNKNRVLCGSFCLWAARPEVAPPCDCEEQGNSSSPSFGADFVWQLPALLIHSSAWLDFRNFRLQDRMWLFAGFLGSKSTFGSTRVLPIMLSVGGVLLREAKPAQDGIDPPHQPSADSGGQLQTHQEISHHPASVRGGDFKENGDVFCGLAKTHSRPNMPFSHVPNGSRCFPEKRRLKTIKIDDETPPPLCGCVLCLESIWCLF